MHFSSNFDILPHRSPDIPERRRFAGPTVSNLGPNGDLLRAQMNDATDASAPVPSDRSQLDAVAQDAG